MKKNLMMALIVLFLVGFLMGFSFKLTDLLTGKSIPLDFSITARYFGDNTVYIAVENTGNTAIDLKNSRVYANGAELPVVSLQQGTLWTGNSTLIVVSNASYGEVCGKVITLGAGEKPKNISTLVLC